MEVLGRDELKHSSELVDHWLALCERCWGYFAQKLNTWADDTRTIECQSRLWQANHWVSVNVCHHHWVSQQHDWVSVSVNSQLVFRVRTCVWLWNVYLQKLNVLSHDGLDSDQPGPPPGHGEKDNSVHQSHESRAWISRCLLNLTVW